MILASRLRPATIKSCSQVPLFTGEVPSVMPRKIRDLIRDLERAGFVNRGGRGSHRNFVHPKLSQPITLSGREGADAKVYQEQAVQRAIQEVQS